MISFINKKKLRKYAHHSFTEPIGDIFKFFVLPNQVQNPKIYTNKQPEDVPLGSEKLKWASLWCYFDILYIND